MRFLFPFLLMLSGPCWLVAYAWIRRKRDASPAGHGKNGGARRVSDETMIARKRNQNASHWIEP